MIGWWVTVYWPEPPLADGEDPRLAPPSEPAATHEYVIERFGHDLREVRVGDLPATLHPLASPFDRVGVEVVRSGYPCIYAIPAGQLLASIRGPSATSRAAALSNVWVPPGLEEVHNARVAEQQQRIDNLADELARTPANHWVVVKAWDQS